MGVDDVRLLGDELGEEPRCEERVEAFASFELDDLDERGLALEVLAEVASGRERNHRHCVAATAQFSAEVQHEPLLPSET
jgi:hypothetical protein